MSQDEETLSTCSTESVHSSEEDSDAETVIMEGSPPTEGEMNHQCFPQHLVELNKARTVYRCDFNLKPEMLKYYYSPGPEGYVDGQPVLINSPAFYGGFETKWCLNITFNRWIGHERWVSLYLTRVNNDSADELSLSCTFKVIDKNNQVLFSRANAGVLESIPSFQPNGYTTFLPFSKIPSVVVNGTCFRVEAELTLFQHVEAQETFLLEDEMEDLDKTLSIHDETETESGQAEALAGPSSQVVSLSDMTLDQIALCVNDAPCAILDIVNVIAKNVNFKLDTIWFHQGRILVEIPEICEDENWLRKIVIEFAQFIQSDSDSCDLLMEGDYEDIYLLFKLAEIVNAVDLMSLCLTTMTLKCTPETAAAHVGVLEMYIGVVEVDSDIMAAFEAMFKQNFMSIRKTESFKRLLPSYAEEFTDLAFAPSCFD